MTQEAVPAVSVALVKGRELLLVKRGRAPSRGMYAFPGGRVEPGESPEAAARRELQEETGLHVSALALHREYMLEAERGHPPFRLMVFTGHAVSGNPVPGDDAEEAVWLDLPALERLPTPASVLEVARELLGAA